MSKYNECTRVQVPAAEHLVRLGYDYIDKNDIAGLGRDEQTNILTDIFKTAVERLNPGMSGSEREAFCQRVAQVTNNDDLGREFYQLLAADGGIKMLDYEHPERNAWHVGTEVACKNPETGNEFRPDITVFVNGLPLAFIEVKKPDNQDGIIAERNRINNRMRRKSFRRYLNLAQVMIFSNNQEYDNENRVPIQGAFYACPARERVFFNVFREEDKDLGHFPLAELTEATERKILKDRNCEVIRSTAEYKTNQAPNSPTHKLLTSLLSKERLLFLLRYGIAYVEQKYELSDGTQGRELQKHIVRYQQFFALRAIRNTIAKGTKSGIIWHTQGSGKTALSYYAVKYLTAYFAQQNTVSKFYFIVDRIDLMEQATEEFAARGLSVRNATSRDELMRDIKDTSIISNSEGRLEIMVVNIQKFKEDTQTVKLDGGYNTRLQRVFFIDEAHRGYNPKGCFLANLLDADRDAVKIALTGTPLLKEERESWRVFGDYIHTYYYDRSIADGYTRKLMREPIETIYKEKIEKILDDLAGSIEVRKSDIDRDKIIEHEAYLTALMEYIVADFGRFRIEQGDPNVGAMVVCKTNAQARKLHGLWQKRQTEQQDVPKAVLILHDEGDKFERKQAIGAFRKQTGADVLIVNKMLLTGFDAPRLKKLYLGRQLDGHDLLQALTRVNRPYKDFKYGYVVDFVDIKENFDTTNDRYLRELNRTKDDETPEKTSVGQVILVSRDEVEEKIKEVREILFPFATDDMEQFRKEIGEVEEKSSLYELRHVLEDAKAIVNQARAFGDDETRETLAKIPVGALGTMLSEVEQRIARLNLLENTEHQADVAGIVNLALSELEFEFKKGIPEELRIAVNDLRERQEKVKAEFERNFDHQEERYVNLAEEFRAYFKEKGFVPRDVADFKESLRYMDGVMKKIREINQRNEALKRKYREDEKFVRIHKRIVEQNAGREKPIISKWEAEIADNLSQMKDGIDEAVLKNSHQLENERAFEQDTLAKVSAILREAKIAADVNERKVISRLIATEYLQQYNTAQH